jgi:hypothetical protein
MLAHAMAHVAAILNKVLQLLIFLSFGALVVNIAALHTATAAGMAGFRIAVSFRLDAVNFRRISVPAAFGFS